AVRPRSHRAHVWQGHNLLLVALQRRQFHTSLLRVSPVNRLALVTQRLLRVAFGITHSLGSLSPRIAIRVQTDARKPESLAQMPEVRCPVRRRKLRPGRE